MTERETIGSETPVEAPRGRRTFVLGLRRAALAGSVAVVALGAGNALMSAHPGQALAEAVAVEPVQAPSFADVAEAVRPAVVSVRVRQAERDGGRRGLRGERGGDRFGDRPQFRDLPEDHPLHRFFRDFGDRRSEGRPDRRRPRRFDMSQGSGFIISEDGYIVTNNHVVENAKEISVVLSNGDEKDAELIGADRRTDLAVLKIKGDDYKYVAFSDGDIRVGEWVVSMGNPFGLGGTVTAGIVSARGRDIGAGPYDDFLQIDAAVNRGNSGGPTFSLDGKVVGVNTAIFSPNGGNVGIAFAIPAATASDIVASLIDKGSVTRGWLGVQIQPVTPDIAESLALDSETGAIVADVTPDSPADKAGVETGDTILAVNGASVADPKELSRRIAAVSPGKTTDIEVWRDGRKQVIAVEIGTLPARDRLASADTGQNRGELTAFDDLGLELARNDGQVVIADVDPDGEAALKGLRSGDRILKVNGDAVKAPGEVHALIAEAEEAGRKAVLFLVQSGERARFVALDLKDA